MKNGTESLPKKMISFRVSPHLCKLLDAEIRRQGRKRDVVASRVVGWFLGLKQRTRDDICAQDLEAA